MEKIEKTDHEDVEYEHPSQHGGQRCADCIHLIVPGLMSGAVRCETVKDPIRVTDWCERWQDRG